MDYKISYDNELKHYGVLRMKWGVHRARKKGTNYVYKSHGQKKYQKKYDEALAKANRKAKKTGKGISSRTQSKLNAAKRKLSIYKLRDSNRQDYVESTTAGASIVRSVLTGAITNGNYTRLRASGRSVTNATLGTIGTIVLSSVVPGVGTVGSVVGTRRSEFNTAETQYNTINDQRKRKLVVD